MIASALSVLYGYLYTLLTLERYALLVGSLGLFTALAAVMYLTRWVDWHRVHRAARRRPAPAPDGAPAS